MKLKPGVVEHCLVDTSKWERNTTGANGARGVKVLRFRARRRVRVAMDGRGSVFDAVLANDEQAARAQLALISAQAGAVDVVDAVGEIAQSSHEISAARASASDSIHPQAVQNRASFWSWTFQLIQAIFRQFGPSVGVSASKSGASEAREDGTRVWS